MILFPPPPPPPIGINGSQFSFRVLPLYSVVDD